MTSQYGYTDGSYDIKQKYNIRDLQGPLPRPIIKKGTILDALGTVPEAKQFRDLLMSIPLSGIYNDTHACVTLFVPCTFPPIKGDYEKRQFVLYHTLEKPVSLTFLRSSPKMLLNTRVEGETLLVENNNDVCTVNKQPLRAYQSVTGAIIYYVDGPILKFK